MIIELGLFGVTCVGLGYGALTHHRSCRQRMEADKERERRLAYLARWAEADRRVMMEAMRVVRTTGDDTVRDALNQQLRDLRYAHAQRPSRTGNPQANMASAIGAVASVAVMGMGMAAMAPVRRRRPWPWPKRPGWLALVVALDALSSRQGNQRRAAAVVRRQAPRLWRMLLKADSRKLPPG